MGACYSKNATGTKTSEKRAVKQKQSTANQIFRKKADSLSSENVPLQENEKNGQEIVESSDAKTPRTSVCDLVLDHGQQVDHSIAPSDSGIESIGTAHEDSPGRQERNALLKRLEHQNIAVCNSCGTSDVTVTLDKETLCKHCQVCSSNSQNKKSPPTPDIINSDFGKQIFTSADNTICIIKDFQNGEAKSGVAKSAVFSKGKNIAVSLWPPRKSDVTQTTVSENVTPSKFSGVMSGSRAPLAQHDILDINFSDILTEKKSCKQQNSSDSNTASSERIETLQLNHINGGQELSSHLNQPPNGVQDDRSSFQNSVLLADQKQPECRILPESSNVHAASVIEDSHVNDHFESTSESPSGIYNGSSKATSPSFISSKLKVKHEPPASVISGETMTSSSSSGSVEDKTDDDMTSLDLDSISRLTYQSTSSIRQPPENAGTLPSLLNTTMHSTIDGVDCVIIAKETYQQMQTDLTVLKQQLLCLSSLMQASEGFEEKT